MSISPHTESEDDHAEERYDWPGHRPEVGVRHRASALDGTEALEHEDGPEDGHEGADDHHGGVAAA